MMTNEVVGVVMVGGASSRMGSDKSALSIGGQTLTQLAINTFNKAGINRIVLSSGSKMYGIQDQKIGKGPLGGMHAVMLDTSVQDASGFLFLPVDMPMMTVELVKLLVESGFAETTVCYFKNRPMPCYLPNTAKVVQALELALNENRLAVKNLLNRLDAFELVAPQNYQDVFTNINTPAQWLNYKQSSRKNID